MLWVTVWFHKTRKLDNFPAIGVFPTIFGVDRDLMQDFRKMCQKFLSDPQKRPYGQKFLPRRAFLPPKFRTKFYSQNHPESKMGRKILPGVSKTSFGLTFTIFIIFQVCRNFYDSGRIFENLTCGSNFFQKSPILKMVKNHHFSTFVVFIFHFGQSGLNCPHLPNFASQKFLRAQLGGTL